MNSRMILFPALTAGLFLAGCKAYDDGTVPPAPPTKVTQLDETRTVIPDKGWEPAVPMNGWHYIVVHHSATPGGSAKSFEEDHRKNRHWENGMGYHFVIGNGVDVADGLVEIGDRWKNQIQGAHVGGDLNKEAIGICLVGDFTKTHPTAKQLASLDRLVRFLQARCSIPASRVVGHEEARPGHTVCPGTNFSMCGLRSSLAKGAKVAYHAPAEPTAPPTPGAVRSAVPMPQIHGSISGIR